MKNVLEKKLIKLEKEKGKLVEERQKVQEKIDIYEGRLKKMNLFKNEYEKIDNKVKDFFEKLEGVKTNDRTGK